MKRTIAAIILALAAAGSIGAGAAVAASSAGPLAAGTSAQTQMFHND